MEIMTRIPDIQVLVLELALKKNDISKNKNESTYYLEIIESLVV
jgi:hypothetical protein